MGGPGGSPWERGAGLLRRRGFQEPSGQITLAVHGAAHHEISAGQFVKEDMLVERSKEEKEPPIAEASVGESAGRPQMRMLAQQPAGSLNGIEVTVSHIGVCVGKVPGELALDISKELVRLADLHVLEGAGRRRARWRMPSKSARDKGVEGWSAACRSQASSSGVTWNGLRCCSRTERRTSLASSPGSAATPARTCSCRNSSTSLASAMVTARAYHARSAWQVVTSLLSRD